MRTYLLLATCLVLVGCGRQKQNHRELMSKLEAIQSEVTSKSGTPVHWALADKSEITTVIYQLIRDKMEEVKKSEALPPEVEEKVTQYEALQTELMHKRMENMGLRSPPRAPGADAAATDKDYEALSQIAAEAKAPIAAIVERRSRRDSQYREQYSAERLIAEYVKDRYDLVVDTREKVLYRSASEVPDITEGVIAFVKGKAKP